MKAARLHAFGKPLRVEQVPDPQPELDEVLVRVEACGVCHSDLHMARGDWASTAARMQLPAILGHEVVGRIVALGRAATDRKVGQRVGVGWLHSTCGRCEHCRAGAENVCLERTVTGVESPGGFAELIRIRARQTVPVPETLPAAEAAPLLCAGVTVYHAVAQAAISRGERVAVIGIGGLGHLAVQLAALAGGEVTAVDVVGEKLELARRLGARHAVQGTREGEAALARDAAPHVAIVTAPAKAAYDLALRTLRRRGRLVVVGIPKDDLTIFADDLVVGEFHILGSAVGTREDTRAVLALAAEGKLRCEIETYPLEAINEVFDRMARGALRARAAVLPKQE